MISLFEGVVTKFRQIRLLFFIVKQFWAHVASPNIKVRDDIEKATHQFWSR